MIISQRNFNFVSSVSRVWTKSFPDRRNIFFASTSVRRSGTYTGILKPFAAIAAKFNKAPEKKQHHERISYV